MSSVRKIIPICQIYNLAHKPWRIPERDEDDEIVWKDPTAQVPEMKKADTLGVLWTVLFTIPPKLEKQNDPRRLQQAWNQMERAREQGNGEVEFSEKVYLWLHRLLNREMPLTEEEKREKLLPRTYARALFRGSAFAITEQLKPLDERVDPWSVGLGDLEEDAKATEPDDEEKPRKSDPDDE